MVFGCERALSAGLWSRRRQAAALPRRKALIYGFREISSAGEDAHEPVGRRGFSAKEFFLLPTMRQGTAACRLTRVRARDKCFCSPFRRMRNSARCVRFITAFHFYVRFAHAHGFTPVARLSVIPLAVLAPLPPSIHSLFPIPYFLLPTAYCLPPHY